MPMLEVTSGSIVPNKVYNETLDDTVVTFKTYKRVDGITPTFTPHLIGSEPIPRTPREAERDKEHRIKRGPRQEWRG